MKQIAKSLSRMEWRWTREVFASAMVASFAIAQAAHGQLITGVTASNLNGAFASNVNDGHNTTTLVATNPPAVATYDNGTVPTTDDSVARSTISASYDGTNTFAADMNAAGYRNPLFQSLSSAVGSEADSQYHFIITMPTPFTLTGSIVAENSPSATINDGVWLFKSNPGNSGTVFILQANSTTFSQSFNTSGVLVPGDYDMYAFTGHMLNANGSEAVQNRARYTLVLGAVPEPSTLVTMILGGGVLLASLRGAKK